MRIDKDVLETSATDLATFMGCQHATHLDKKSALGELEKPYIRSKLLKELAERGLQHEQNYLAYLCNEGYQVTELTRESPSEDLMRAMREGPDYIYQAPLEYLSWRGVADFLVKVSKPSNLGDYSYEVLDAKLARETRGETILQLCVYSDVLSEIQGAQPEYAYVLTPGAFEPEPYRLVAFSAYYRRVRTRFLDSVQDIEQQDSYPEPCEKCDRCDWIQQCKQRWRGDDHLVYVAGVNKSQRHTLSAQGLGTLQAFADHEDIEALPIKSASQNSYRRLRNQARLQSQARESGELTQSLLPLEPDADPKLGVYLLPAPSPGDVFFDIEGARFVGDHGFEYLLGYSYLDSASVEQYIPLVADSPAEEARAFSDFMQQMVERIQTWPDMHIYHFHSYEPSAIKRLSGRYAAYQDELDDMLRHERFVDLHAVTKHTVQCGIERYSIKDLEPYFDFDREVDLQTAGDARHALEKWLEEFPMNEAPKETVAIVVDYNKDDCFATRGLRDWLEGFRSQWIDNGHDIPRPEPDPEVGQELSERLRKMRELSSNLRDGLPELYDDVSDEDKGQWLLSHLIEFHRREDKSRFWEKFRLAALDEEERLEEKSAIAALSFIGTIEQSKTGIPTDQYSFPNQELTIKPGDDLWINQDDALLRWGTVSEIDHGHLTIDVKKSKKTADIHADSAFSWGLVNSDKLAEAIFNIGERWLAGEDLGVIRALLDRSLPRFDQFGGLDDARATIADEFELAYALVRQIQASVLPIQGPPGTGKTYTGAHMILAAVEAGKKVGVVAQSHKVISNLLKEVASIAREQEIEVPVIRNPGTKGADPDDEDDMITLGGNGDVETGLGNEYSIAGGTAWMWARPEMANSVDILFVDEAGQYSLANTVAVSQAAPSLVLLGDPQQLDQPLQGTHPPGTDASGLAHLLGEHATMPRDRGLFLPETYRMHPDICSYISDLAYEGHLHSEPERANQSLVHPDFPERTGLWYLPVEHSDNTNSSIQEADRVQRLINQLLSGGMWIDHQQQETNLSLEDILVVTPYNAQVGEILQRIPGARVGTVDKFQGQQAPIVIISYATSTPEEAPRGMDFLYSLNRLNVAVSRAKCAVFLICSPRLLEPECRLPWQMRLANGLASYVEHSR